MKQQSNAPAAKVSAESERWRRLYETVLTHTPDILYVFDLKHRFISANKALLAMWGRIWNEAIGKTCLELGYEPWHAAMQRTHCFRPFRRSASGRACWFPDTSCQTDDRGA